jgi:hypothetical protein
MKIRPRLSFIFVFIDIDFRKTIWRRKKMKKNKDLKNWKDYFNLFSQLSFLG